MNSDALVLRSILRLARRREVADETAVALRVASSPREVRNSLRRLAASGLVERTHAGRVRLSMAGLAIAVALLPQGNAPSRRRAQRTSRAA
jgi:Mn-dependent DtxR family transcriptional regulator